MTLQGQVTALQGQQGPTGGPAQPELPEEAGTNNQEKDEKQSQNDKTELGKEKTVKDKAKSKPE
ncbi:hypothetical protein Tco_0314837, partial [Tanacetum coccineum]